MTATPNFASGAFAGAEAGGAAASAPNAGPFVLNLCSSTTPMALAQIDLPELRRFTFFVSRRFEEGRERFRLHMGYFATLAEAEEWLGLVREIYPGAWAGEAPGRKLRERAAAAVAAQAQHAAGPQPHAPTPPAAPSARAPLPTRAPQLSAPAIPRAIQAGALRVPVVHAAPPLAPTARAPVAPPIARPAMRQTGAAGTPVGQRLQVPAVSGARPVVPPPAAAAAARVPLKPPPGAPRPGNAPAARTAPVLPPRVNAPAARTAPVPPPRATQTARPEPGARPQPGMRPPPGMRPQPAARQVAPGPASRATAPTAPGARNAKPIFEDSNVREVLKALGDASATGETRLMQAPPPPREATTESSSLTDTQVLKLLEARRPEGSEPPPEEISEGGIPLLKPDDTGTRRALKEAIASNAPVAFAVQLHWSVQPVELDKVPPLAIFSAYTLYTVEGSRDGRRWYGLRLGFFSDAISAKQVAYYVRSEFTSVAVVPVSPQEKARATDQDMAATLAAPVPTRSDPMDEFKLFDDDGSARAPAVPAPPAVAAAAAKPKPRVAIGRALREAGPQPRVRSRGGKVGAREHRGSQTLEETLEILGASQLSIDPGSGETLNDSAVRHLRVEVQKNSPFSKLLERLSERLKKH
jgi:hypothetical protein